MKRGRTPFSYRVSSLKMGCVPFLLLMTPAAFACDVALQATVAAKPADSDTRDALARSCARAGAHTEALAQYDVLLALDAANVDWKLGKSQALIALGRPREALPLLYDARRQTPGYEDVWRANANALDQLDEFDAADTLLSQAAVQFPQSAWPRERQAALRERRLLERGTRISADLSYEELSGDRPAWKGASLGVNHPLGDHRHVFGGVHLEERFDTRDEQLLFGYAARLNDTWSYGSLRRRRARRRDPARMERRRRGGPRAAGRLGHRLSPAPRELPVLRRRHAVRRRRQVFRCVQHRLLAQRREDLRLRRPELRAPAAFRARIRQLEPRCAHRRLRRGGRDRRTRRRAGDRHEEHRVHRAALDEHGLGHRLGGGLVRTGRPVRPVPDPRWTRTPVLNSSSRWRGAVPRSPASAPRCCC